MLNRKTPPEREYIEEVPYIKPKGTKLDNGLSLYYLEGGTEDFVKVEFVLFAGSFCQEKPLVSFATANLLRSGSLNHNRQQINELLDYYSAHLQVEAMKDFVSVSIFVLNKYLEPAIKLLADIIFRPTFPEDEMLNFLKNQKQLHLVNQKKVQHLARTYFTELVYGEQHPYGYRLKPEDFDKPSRDDLALFHKRWYYPANAFCIVSGRVPENIELLVSKYFKEGVIQDDGIPQPPQYPMLSSGSRKVFLEVPGAVQSAIRVGKQLFNRTHPAYHRLKITNALFGGYFGSRLMQNIRQEKGYTYGVFSNIISLKRSGFFFISTQVGADVRKSALEEIYREIRELRNRPATESEMESLRNYLGGSFLRSFDGPVAQSERFRELLIFGLDYSHFDDYLKTLKTITPEAIMETAADYLNEDGMMEVVAGK